MNETEKGFWRKVYVAAIRRGYAPEAAARVANTSLELYRTAWAES